MRKKRIFLHRWKSCITEYKRYKYELDSMQQMDSFFHTINPNSSIRTPGKLKTALNQRFLKSDLGPCAYHLSMTITRDKPNPTPSLSQTTRVAQKSVLYPITKISPCIPHSLFQHLTTITITLGLVCMYSFYLLFCLAP